MRRTYGNESMHGEVTRGSFLTNLRDLAYISYDSVTRQRNQDIRAANNLIRCHDIMGRKLYF